MIQPYLSIILPVYNEEKRLHLGLHKLTHYLWSETSYRFEILAVLNGCVDRSAVIAKRFSRNWRQITILDLPERGKGRAVRAGMLAARGKYRMMMDVDMATPPEVIPQYLEAVKAGYDVVTGRREMEKQTFLRNAAHETFRMLAHQIAGVEDPQSGFKMFRANCAEQVFRKVRLTGWSFDVEALYLAGILGYKVKEIMVPWRNGEGSKVNPITDGARMALDLMQIRKLHEATTGDH